MNRIRHSLILVTLALTLSACGGDPGSHADHGHAHDDHAHDGHGHDDHADHDHAEESETRISLEMAKANNIATAVVASGTIRETLTLTGRTEPNAERVRVVRARYPGTVKAGQTLARIESDDSLQTYAVTAPIGGTVVKRSTNPGESSGTEALFEIIDSKTLWANLAAFPSDRNRLKSGQRVDVTAADGSAQYQGTISLIASSLTGPTSIVRVVIDNSDARWTPGQFLNAEVTINEKPAAITVPVTALQNMRGRDVVFLVDGNRYQAQPVTTGRRDSQSVEITSGLSIGARIVTRNSFLIKADIEKSGAAHDH
jgi:cobalt-zinc-cadmium efflux system membrane fusion protein